MEKLIFQFIFSWLSKMQEIGNFVLNENQATDESREDIVEIKRNIDEYRKA